MKSIPHLNSDCDFFRYDVKFQNGMDCGGAYIKLLSHYDGFKPVRFFFPDSNQTNSRLDSIDEVSVQPALRSDPKFGLRLELTSWCFLNL